MNSKPGLNEQFFTRVERDVEQFYSRVRLLAPVVAILSMLASLAVLAALVLASLALYDYITDGRSTPTLRDQ